MSSGTTPVTNEQATAFIIDFLTSFTEVKVIGKSDPQLVLELPKLNNYRIILSITIDGTSLLTKGQSNKHCLPYVYRWKNVTCLQRANNTRRLKGWMIHKLDMLAKKMIDEDHSLHSSIGHLIIRPVAFNYS